MKNTMTDLHNHLFEQLERLNDESLVGERLEEELDRAEGMKDIAAQIIQNGELAFKVMRHADEYGYGGEKRELPEIFRVKGGA